MGLESATFISQLVPTNPVGAVDDYATADDHLRLLKTVLQSQFPNFAAAAINPTDVELNLLVGLLASSAELNILDGALLSTAELNTLNGIVATTAELNKLNGVTSLTADLNLLSGAAAGGLTAAELLFVADVTSALQAQLDGKAPSAHSHTGAEISDLDTADVTTGTWANARVSAGNVTQHVGAIDHDLLLNFASGEHVLHSGVNMAAGTFLGGGGAIDASRTFNLDFAGEPAFSGAVAGADSFIINDGGTLKTLRHQDAAIPVTVDTSTAYAPAIADANKLVTLNNALAIAVTIPANVSVAFPIGTIFNFVQLGAGQVTVSVTTDTLVAANGTKTKDQYSMINVLKVAVTTWVLTGDAEV